MALHANAEGLDALQQLKGIGRRETGAEVAQAFGPRAHDEGRVAELLVEHDAVIAGIRFGQHRKFAGSVPVEPAAIDDHAADGDAVAADPFGGECMTISAPSSIGRLRNGVAKVLSISSGIFASCAIAATRGISSTSRPGLPMVSPITRRVLGRIAARNPSRSRGLTKVVVMPKRGSVCDSRLMVPP